MTWKTFSLLNLLEYNVALKKITIPNIRSKKGVKKGNFVEISSESDSNFNSSSCLEMLLENLLYEIAPTKETELIIINPAIISDSVEIIIFVFILKFCPFSKFVVVSDVIESEEI